MKETDEFIKGFTTGAIWGMTHISKLQTEEVNKVYTENLHMQIYYDYLKETDKEAYAAAMQTRNS